LSGKPRLSNSRRAGEHDCASGFPVWRLIQLGLGGDISIPQNMIVSKEIEIRGSFRFHEEFALAVDLINRRRVDLKPLLTEVVPLAEAVRGFELASNRARAMKVQIAF
jgi:L-idonate 5-dehydrogenase